jgi:hypothetical protein
VFTVPAKMGYSGVIRSPFRDSCASNPRAFRCDVRCVPTGRGYHPAAWGRRSARASAKQVAPHRGNVAWDEAAHDDATLLTPEFDSHALAPQTDFEKLTHWLTEGDGWSLQRVSTDQHASGRFLIACPVVELFCHRRMELSGSEVTTQS